jgi:hypothetical protein
MLVVILSDCAISRLLILLGKQLCWENNCVGKASVAGKITARRHRQQTPLSVA